MTRKELREAGYLPVAKSADLFAYGYTIVWWLSPALLRERKPSLIYEYVPRPDDPRNRHNRGRTLPRMTAATFQEQALAHRAMGAPAPSMQLPLWEE